MENPNQFQQPYNEEYYQLIGKQKKCYRDIWYIGLMLGGAILLYIFIENVFATILSAVGLYSTYVSDGVFQFTVDSFMTLIALLLPFSLAGRFISRRDNIHYLAPTNFPRDRKMAALAIPVGLGFCMAGNIVTSWLSSAVTLTGHEFTMPDMDYPEGIAGFLLSTIRVALVAAVVEELCFRGTTLQPLRRYGNGFAVLMSAIVFGIIHGNLVQAPFALIAGIGLGWICVMTGSIWPSMAVHFLNNFISVVFNYLLETDMSEQAVNVAYVILLYTLLIVGGVCAYFFFRKNMGTYFNKKGDVPLSAGKKFLYFIGNPTMIISLIYIIYITVSYIK